MCMCVSLDEFVYIRSPRRPDKGSIDLGSYELPNIDAENQT